MVLSISGVITAYDWTHIMPMASIPLITDHFSAFMVENLSFFFQHRRLHNSNKNCKHSRINRTKDTTWLRDNDAFKFFKHIKWIHYLYRRIAIDTVRNVLYKLTKFPMTCCRLARPAKFPIPRDEGRMDRNDEEPLHSVHNLII